MLANLRRKVGLGSGINTPIPTQPPPGFAEMVVSPTFVDPTMPPPFTMEELGFLWPSGTGVVSPSAVPVWLQEQVGILCATDTCVHSSQSLADLGLPVNGSDGIFLNMQHTNGWTGDFVPGPEAW